VFTAGSPLGETEIGVTRRRREDLDQTGDDTGSGEAGQQRAGDQHHANRGEDPPPGGRAGQPALVLLGVVGRAGRIRLGPAPQNLAIPPYSFASDTKIKIG